MKAVTRGFVKAARKNILSDPGRFIEQCREDMDTCQSTIDGCAKLVKLLADPPEGFNRDKALTALAKSVMRMATMQRNLLSISTVVAASKVIKSSTGLDLLDDVFGSI